MAPSAEVWSWKARAYAASQVSTTRQMVRVLPRSTRSHCGSLAALAQRVPGLPSTAADAARPASWMDEAVAGLPCATLALPQVGVLPPVSP